MEELVGMSSEIFGWILGGMQLEVGLSQQLVLLGKSTNALN